MQTKVLFHAQFLGNGDPWDRGTNVNLCPKSGHKLGQKDKTGASQGQGQKGKIPMSLIGTKCLYSVPRTPRTGQRAAKPAL